MQCRFPLCECDANGAQECARPRYHFEIADNGDCMIFDPDGNSIGVLHSAPVAQQYVDELNALEAA